MFTDLLATPFVSLVVGAVAFVAGLVLSTKVTDIFKGIPADLRATLNTVESAAVSKVAAAKTTIVSSAVSTALADLKLAAPAAAPAPAPAPLAPLAPAPLAPVAKTAETVTTVTTSAAPASPPISG
jgi:hypothetical protein